MVRKLQESDLQKFSSSSFQINKISARKIASLIIHSNLRDYDQKKMINFINKYQISTYSFFLIEIYRYLYSIDVEKAKDYINFYKNRETLEKNEFNKPTYQIPKKNKNNKILEKNIRRLAKKRAFDQNLSRKAERSATSEKIKEFFASVQKFK